jgi:CheY-like chemotaxis protein/nitrogen-specific signal transduction histidine kinase
VITGIADLAGTPGVVVNLRDNTDRKRADMELARARDAAFESARLKSAFLNNMSHEIRTPINVILGYSDLLTEVFSEAGDKTHGPYLAAIARAGRRLQETISRILDYSTIEAGGFSLKLEQVQLAPLIERCIADHRALAAAKGLVLKCEITEPTASVIFDQYCLSQSLANLIQNAVKFSARGEIHIRTRRDSARTLRLDVVDTGIGIDSKFLPRLLEPFSQEEVGLTRRFEGSGLGLALTNRFLQLNGARLAITSVKGAGSTFTIELPPGLELGCNTTGAPLDPQLTPAPDNAGRRTIMLVEDDADMQAFVRVLLAPYRLIVAGSAAETRRVLETTIQSISLVLMDLNLRGAEDGVSLTRYLRSLAPFRSTPIIALTAHAAPEDRSLLIAAGFDDFLRKPFSRTTLIAAIDARLAAATPPFSRARSDHAHTLLSSQLLPRATFSAITEH